MKKYLFTMVVMAIFAIGFAASDDDSSSSSDPQKKEQKFRAERGSCIEAARCYGESIAKESANDLIRQGYAKSDLKGIAAQQAKLEYKTVGDCCNPQYFEENYKEYFTKSNQQKLVEQCREAYVIGYMSALGKTYNY